MLMTNQFKRSDNQYIDVLLCFCKYYLISKKQPHNKEDVLEFLLENNMSDLEKATKGLNKDSIPYATWQIFDFMNKTDLERIRQDTILLTKEKIEKEREDAN